MAFVAVQKFQVKNKRKCLEQLLISVLTCDTTYKPSFSDVSMWKTYCFQCPRQSMLSFQYQNHQQRRGGWKNCVDLRFSHRGSWWSIGAPNTCVAAHVWCVVNEASLSAKHGNTATHVNKVKSSEMLYVIIKTQQQCHVCHKLFPSQWKKNFHLENLHKVSDNSCPYTCFTVCEVLKEVPMFNFEEQFQTNDHV